MMDRMEILMLQDLEQELLSELRYVTHRLNYSNHSECFSKYLKEQEDYLNKELNWIKTKYERTT